MYVAAAPYVSVMNTPITWVCESAIRIDARYASVAVACAGTLVSSLRV